MREMQVDDKGHMSCAWCGWCYEFPDSHVMHCPFCPDVRSRYEVWVDDDGELCARKRDYRWVVPRLLAWARRACARVEREYAPDGPRGREVIEGWDVLQ